MWGPFGDVCHLAVTLSLHSRVRERHSERALNLPGQLLLSSALSLKYDLQIYQKMSNWVKKMTEQRIHSCQITLMETHYKIS